MNQETLKPELIAGKTIKSTTIEKTAIEITFTDGTSIFISLNKLGSTGETINAKYNP